MLIIRIDIAYARSRLEIEGGWLSQGKTQEDFNLALAGHIFGTYGRHVLVHVGSYVGDSTARHPVEIDVWGSGDKRDAAAIESATVAVTDSITRRMDELAGTPETKLISGSMEGFGPGPSLTDDDAPLASDKVQ